MASKLIVNEIEHTDGAGTAVTMAKATIADATLTSATLTAGTLGSGVTGIPAAGITGTLGSGVGFPAGHVLQVQHISSASRYSTTHTSWTEPGADYRVTITPQYSNSMIQIVYQMCFNYGAASNVLAGLRAFRIIDGGSKSYALTSAGTSWGVRHPIAGAYIRPGNGQDTNDMNNETLTCIDHPATTGVCVYGFESYPEGTNTTTWGYSASNNGTWGWTSDIVIIATEVKV
jgi:hypothetical protein